MEIICIKSMSYYLGDIFTEGKEYHMSNYTQKYRIVINYDEYFKYLSLLSNSIITASKDQIPENHHQLFSPGSSYSTYIILNEIYNKYTIEVDIPMTSIEGESIEGNIVSFCLLTENEIRYKYEVDKVYFTNKKMKYIDEYFDYLKIKRDKKLNLIGL
jgi:hypothetical protein